MNKRVWSCVLLVILMTSLLAGCAAPAPASAPEPTKQEASAPQPTAAPATEEVKPASEPKGKITLFDSTGYYPINIFHTSDIKSIQTAMYDSLLSLSLDYTTYECQLCETYEVSPDGKTVVFKLRKDVKFHDGTPLNAEAVKFNFDWYMDPKNSPQLNQDWVDVFTSFDVVDEYTLQVNLKEPYAALYATLGGTLLASPTAYKTLGDVEFSSHPVGTGPFMAVEVVENSSILYKRNPDYKWGPKWSSGEPPKVEEFEIRFVKDNAVAYAALETGEATFIKIAPQFIPAAEKNDKLAVNKGVGVSVYYFGWNNSLPMYQDPAMREALSHAINREEIILAAFEGEAYALATFIPPATYGFTEEQNKYAEEKMKLDPALSIKMLDELGYKDVNGDGVREDKEGKPLYFKLYVTNAEELERAAQTIQGQLSEVGLKVEVIPMDSAARSDLLYNCESDLYIGMYGWNDPFILTLMTQKPPNWTCWDDPKVQELGKAINTTMDLNVRANAVTEQLKYMADNYFWVPLWADYNAIGYRKNLKGILWDVAGNPNFLDAYFEGE